MKLNDRFRSPAGTGVIGRYTTPVHTFSVPVDPTTITLAEIDYAQGGELILTKELSDCELGDGCIIVRLTEDDTALFNADEDVKIQLRLGIGAARLNSAIESVRVEDVLRDAPISEAGRWSL